MLIWCAYCQKFMGEAPDYDTFNISHGICAECATRWSDLTEADIAHARRLEKVQKDLYSAAKNNDLNEAVRIIGEAEKANIRPVDILVGIIAPILYDVGEEWKRGVLSVADEHRFTTFCEKTFDLIAGRMGVGNDLVATGANEVDILLANAPGNKHTLGIRILALWLLSRGRRVQIVDPPGSLASLVETVRRRRPRLLLISMALAEQSADVAEIAQTMAKLPIPHSPRVLVGGYAVKSGLVKEIPGADLTVDIGAL